MAAEVREVELPTAVGTARVAIRRPRGAVGTLVLGHGAGGGVQAVDLVAARDAAVVAGWVVASVEQPWRVAGRRVAPAPARLDEGWLAVLAALGPELPGPLVVGGRSAGARVACRTAGATGADGVLALAFPLHPPGRPERSRAAELSLAVQEVRAVLVVQGGTDPFGTPAELRQALTGPAAHRAQVVRVPGDHALRADPAAVASAVSEFLATFREQAPEQLSGGGRAAPLGDLPE